ncbi:hypothetical protein FEAC_14050 [Ferrimicrobium acidiphilum DSM 19497]|uniref:Uncharacterized protein n=1 Tax=Ferrimicrobium acidiphilum DSM 19497 TaxID=1121877 RepID=A0A0D8FUE3_9ACTN|nr:hypothetical protein FEAC_14050 [Ferrimicrobium acidiphilum DSM 19497]
MAGPRIAVRGLVDDCASGVGMASFAGHDIVVVHWIVFHGQLEKSIEEEVPAPGSSAVEPQE